MIAQRTPAVAPQKKAWRSQAQFRHQLDRPSATTTKRSYRKHRGQFKTSMIAASPSLFHGSLFWASSAHPREGESDSFLACAVKKTERGWGRRARDDACRRSRLLSSVFVSRAMCETDDYGNAMLPKKVKISKILAIRFCTTRFEHKSSQSNFKT